MIQRLINQMNCLNMARWWLTGILLFLPFQRMLAKSVKIWSPELSDFSRYINYIDEVTIVLFFPFAALKLFKDRKGPFGIYLLLVVPLFSFAVCGLASGILNGNSLFITIAGIFDYIKYFFVIFIYAAFFKDFNDFKKIFRSLLILAVFLGVTAFVQEVWALVSRYVLERDFRDVGNYFLSSLPLDLHRTIILDHWRFGIYRTPSLVRNPNLLGLYSLLFLSIYLSIKNRANILVLGALLTGVFFSISRRTYMCLAVLTGLLLLKNRMKWGVVALSSVLLFLFSLETFTDNGIRGLMEQLESAQVGIAGEDYGSALSGEENQISYRKYAKERAMEIWRDYPLLGVGPGMFGGKVSVRMRWSPVYEEYGFTAKGLLSQWEGIDQFWPQVMAETGIAGTWAYAYIFVSLLIVFFMLKRETHSEDLKGLFSGVIIFTLLIVVYSLGGVFKFTSVMFTYLAFAGIGLSCAGRKQPEKGRY